MLMICICADASVQYRIVEERKLPDIVKFILDAADSDFVKSSPANLN